MLINKKLKSWVMVTFWLVQLRIELNCVILQI